MDKLTRARGVKIDIYSPKVNLAPSGQVIRHYFKEQLRYYSNSYQSESVTQQWEIFQKDLSPKDCPCFEILSGFILRSSFLVNLYDGSLAGNQLEVIAPDKHHYMLYGYNDVYQLETQYGKEFKDAVEKVFTWHLYIRRCTLEFINGGWMNRSNIKKKLDEMKDKYIYLSQYGHSGVFDKTKKAAFEVKHHE